MTPAEYGELEAAIERMTDIAKGFGLDFYDMRFELVPADVLYTFGAYQGMPTRFSHWSFGKRNIRTHETFMHRSHQVVEGSNTPLDLVLLFAEYYNTVDHRP